MAPPPPPPYSSRPGGAIPEVLRRCVPPFCMSSPRALYICIHMRYNQWIRSKHGISNSPFLHSFIQPTKLASICKHDHIFEYPRTNFFQLICTHPKQIAPSTAAPSADTTSLPHITTHILSFLFTGSVTSSFLPSFLTHSLNLSLIHSPTCCTPAVAPCGSPQKCSGLVVTCLNNHIVVIVVAIIVVVIIIMN